MLDLVSLSISTILFLEFLSLCLQIPLQHNSSDCGIYVLQFIETLVEVSKDLSFVFIGSIFVLYRVLVQCLNASRPLPSTMDEWGTAKVINKRKEIKELITELAQLSNV